MSWKNDRYEHGLASKGVRTRQSRTLQSRGLKVMPKLSKQKVRMFGEDVGFQWSHTGGGSRTFKTSVFNIHLATVEELMILTGYTRRLFEDKRRRRSNKTMKRRLSYFPDLNVKTGKKTFKHRESFKIYLGVMKFRDSFYLIGGEGFEKYLPDKWETLERIRFDKPNRFMLVIDRFNNIEEVMKLDKKIGFNKEASSYDEEARVNLKRYASHQHFDEPDEWEFIKEKGKEILKHKRFGHRGTFSFKIVDLPKEIISGLKRAEGIRQKPFKTKSQAELERLEGKKPVTTTAEYPPSESAIRFAKSPKELRELERRKGEKR